MLDAAAEMVAVQPDQPFGAYWLTLLLPEASGASPEQVALAEKAAQSLIASKSAGNEALAHRALGWIRWQRKEYPAAEEEFRACLKLEPSRAEISAWMGAMLAAQQQPAANSAALWHMARAVSVKDAGALPPAQKKQLTTVLEKLYTAYHGDAGGLDQVLAAAAAAPLPPAGFEIESVAALALARDNPRLAEWLKMRRKLESEEGEKYFADSLRTNPFPRLKGILLQATPAEKPTELTIAVSDPAVAEIVIKLSAELPNGAPGGSSIEFEGTLDSYKKSPFTLILSSDPSKITGWPPK
jgi:tetratricopeptide (TPR) repeat protein